MEHAEPTKPTIGRIVHYKLSEQDAVSMNKRRDDFDKDAEWPGGAQRHVGNLVKAGEIVPMIVVVVWTEDSVNGQAFLDGNDTLWTCSVVRGEGEGQWDWMPYQKEQQAKQAEDKDEAAA